MGISASRFARGTALLVSVSLIATPALAAALSVPAIGPATEAPVASWSPAADVAHDRGWGPPRGHHHHDDGIDGGDLIAGILLLGGIAAIFSATNNANKNKQAEQDRYRTQQPEPRDSAPDYRAQPSQPQNWGEGADMTKLDAAADACVDAVSSRGKVDHVYTVDPSGNGYRVTGDFTTGETFACAVSGGHVDNVYYGSEGGTPYRAAPAPSSRLDQAPSSDDGRYDTSSSPDFAQSPTT